jgi:hypothetical protein
MSESYGGNRLIAVGPILYISIYTTKNPPLLSSDRTDNPSPQNRPRPLLRRMRPRPHAATSPWLRPASPRTSRPPLPLQLRRRRQPRSCLPRSDDAASPGPARQRRQPRRRDVTPAVPHSPLQSAVRRGGRFRGVQRDQAKAILSKQAVKIATGAEQHERFILRSFPDAASV